MMFPIAESLAFLLYGENGQGTSARLSRFLRDELGGRNARYKPIASVICQVWRHGLTHGDEPPFLIVDAVPTAGGYDFAQARSMSWKLALGLPDQHLEVTRYGDQSAVCAFSLAQFFNDLGAVLYDHNLWSSFPEYVIKTRYNTWCSKFIDTTTGTAEAKQAALEIKNVLP